MSNESEMSRKEKRKLLKKLKRVQVRRQVASQRPDGEEEDGNSADENGGGEPAADDEQDRLWRQRDEEAHQEWLRKQKEEADRKLKQEQQRKELEEADVLEEGWEYVEDGPAEITWIGNEIIVKKARRKVRKGIETGTPDLEDKHKPYSNPLPPQSTAFSTHHLNTLPAPEEPVNFGTEQDKRNCPFYIKTGVCRYGVRCSRIHPFVRDKACTLLMQSMYCGAGLSSESSDSLEYTEEEVEQEFEEFYEDVHSEFLQFGELVNFKVCRNGSHHMRGNVYVHFLSPESAVAAYNAINGRFYAKKQITCEFVGITKWRSAICGEYMQANHKGCSHGSACNFMHCFENPRREYEWADWDRPPPRYWKDKMGKLFGYPNLDKDYDRQQRRERHHRDSTPDQGDQRRDRDRMYSDERRRRDSRRAGSDDSYRRERDSGKYVRREQQWKESPYDNNAHSSGRDHYSHDDGGGPSERSRSHRHGDHSGSRSKSGDVHMDKRPRREDRLVSSRVLDQERHDSSSEELGGQSPGRHRDKSRGRDVHRDERSTREKKVISSRKLEQERNDGSSEELGEQNPGRHWDRSRIRDVHKDRRSRRDKKVVSSRKLEQERNDSSTEELGEQSPENHRDRSEGRAHHKDRRSRRSKKTISSGTLERERNGSSSEDLGEPSSERHRDKSRRQEIYKDRRSTREKKLDSPRSVKPEKSASSSEELAEQSPERHRDSERRISSPDENDKGPQRT